jgi:hypothetical protein
MGSLHGQRYTHAERCQRNHRRSAHPDEDHLPENRRDFEKLTGEGRDQNPVEQTEIKLDVTFQIMAASNAQNDKAGAPTKAESLVEHHECSNLCSTDCRDHRPGYGKCVKRNRLPRSCSRHR